LCYLESTATWLAQKMIKGHPLYNTLILFIFSHYNFTLNCFISSATVAPSLLAKKLRNSSNTGSQIKKGTWLMVPFFNLILGSGRTFVSLP
jgi:hypothetical protein